MRSSTDVSARVVGMLCTVCLGKATTGLTKILPFIYFPLYTADVGNLCSKYAASFLYDKLQSRLLKLLRAGNMSPGWKDQVSASVTEAFEELHSDFLKATALVPHALMDQSGTTATAAFVTDDAVMIASLGDSRAVLSSFKGPNVDPVAIQLTEDHVASDPRERFLVEERGGTVVKKNGVYRVGGVLAITRSIGDERLSSFLSRVPHVVSFTKQEIQDACGNNDVQTMPCFLILASDGLWDVVSNQDAVDMVAEVVAAASLNVSSWNETDGLQQAAEALTLESYVRGSKDNIGVTVIAIDA